MFSSSNLTALNTPFKALWRWLMATPGKDQCTKPHLVSQPGPAAVRAAQPVHHRLLQVTPTAARRTSVCRPLRMVRVMEAGQTSSQVGRMVISGRMADVCAELDRLAAFETPLH